MNASQVPAPICEWEETIHKGTPFDLLQVDGNTFRVQVEDASEGQSRVTVQLLASEVQL